MKRFARGLYFVAGMVLSAPCVLAAASTVTLIRGGKIFDGQKVVGVVDVLLREGTIERVGTSLETPTGTVTVDAAGCTLLPGLIDCHTHVIADEMLEKALAFGVTTELDMFMSNETAARVKKENLPTRADLRSAGTLVTAPMGHGTQFGAEIPTLDGPEKADEFVAARIAEGADYIKIVYDTGRSLGLRFPTLSKPTLEAVIKAAKKRGKLTVVHVGDVQSATEALEAGADGLAHVPFDKPSDERLATLAKSKGAFVIATLSVIESACGNPGGGNGDESLAKDARLMPFLFPRDQSALRTSFPRIPFAKKLTMDGPMETVRELHKAGVDVLAGTDAPNPGTVHGVSLHRELELLVKCGFTPAEALAAATSVPAKRFSLADRGRIARGARADLDLVKGDPTADIRATRDIVGVWRAGVRLDRDAYRAKVEQAKLAVEKLKGPGVALVSDFEGKEIVSNFGAGWQVSTDSIMNGKSTATMKLVAGGAQGSKSCLQVAGTIDGGLPFAWAGAMFYPGDAPFSPVDLSGKKRISFYAKGDGQAARIMLFAKKFGARPSMQSFTPTGEWKKFTFDLSSFDKADGVDVMGLLFAGGPTPGKFEFEIDDVAFE